MVGYKKQKQIVSSLWKLLFFFLKFQKKKNKKKKGQKMKTNSIKITADLRKKSYKIQMFFSRGFKSLGKIFGFFKCKKIYVTINKRHKKMVEIEEKKKKEGFQL